MTTKTIRSRFEHEVGDAVEGCRILEKRVVIPPDPVERRRGVYDYLVEVAPAPAKETTAKAPPRRAAATASREESFTRAAPDEMGGGLIRRIPSR
ncbi:MAG TPA: hypothetical protein VME43_23425 [Bryobacteraceae bacterium]|nr:hypothetical protein [Bryobacteraceae bacterium]